MLTPKQAAFVEAYSGNATDAARLAGYRGSDNTLAQVGRQNLRQPQIAAAIQAREDVKSRSRIATREQRQEFWTRTMTNPKSGITARLRASELLGKSQADFTERLHVTGTVTLESLVAAAVKGEE